MSQRLRLEIATPARSILSEEVDEIIAPSVGGQLGILPGHAPLLTLLAAGELTYRQAGEVFHLAVNWGYVEAGADQVLVLVETAERQDQIDLERAQAAMERAEKALQGLSPEDKQFRLMEQALARALARIQVAGRLGRL